MWKENQHLERLYQDFVNIKKLPERLGKPPLYSAEDLAKNLAEYPFKNDFEGEFDSDAIYEAIDALNRRNFNIMVRAPPKYDETIKFELKKESCGVEYSEREMPDKWNYMWNYPKMIPGISSPSLNPYIATDFTIIYDGSQSVPKYPTKVYESDVSELWYRLGDKSLYPYACCYFYFKTPTAMTSVEK